MVGLDVAKNPHFYLGDILVQISHRLTCQPLRCRSIDRTDCGLGTTVPDLFEAGAAALVRSAPGFHSHAVSWRIP